MSQMRPLIDDNLMIAYKKLKFSTENLDPRSYQATIVKEALRKNTIAVLDTAFDRTMIAVMLIKELGTGFGFEEEKKTIVFLVPTVHLVHQQHEVIMFHTNFNTMNGESWETNGMRSRNKWNAESWEKEISANQVMVMTPQTLLDALRKAFITLDRVRLIIFDECHWASGNHPYAKIMKEFYCKGVQKPIIFGMTSSPLRRKGVSSIMDCEKQLAELESIRDSKIYTVMDRGQIAHLVPTAKGVNRYYDPNPFLHIVLKTQLGSLLSKFDASLTHLEGSLLCQFKAPEDILNKSRKDSSSLHEKICQCLDDLCLICANEGAKICSESARLLPAQSCDFYTEIVSLSNSFGEELINAVENYLAKGYESLLNTEQGCREAIKMGYISPKLFERLQILNSFQPDQVRCLIFVERIVTAQVIEHFIKKISYLSHLKVSYLSGGNNSVEAITLKKQKETLELFRHGMVNLLFTTTVSEEGLDVPECSCVISFDLSRTVCSYVLSRGRALQAGSHCVVMIERGNIQQRDLLFSTIKSSHYLCLEACKTLHQLGAPDNHLLPTVEEPMHIDIEVNEKSTAGAGTTKRKELHGTIALSALLGSWAHHKVAVTLQGYKFNFTCNKVDQKYSSFVLLIDTELDKDISCLNIELYSIDKMVNAIVSPCGPIQLASEQVEHAKRFHELFFNGLFGKLFRGSKSSGVPRKFLLMEDDISLWNSSYTYLLLPVESPCVQDEDTVKINWKGIHDSSSVVEHFRHSYMPKADGAVEASLVSESSVVIDGGKIDMVHLANKNVHVQSLKNSIVIAIHTWKVYSVFDVVVGSSAYSQFESPDVANYLDYFTKTYGIMLKHPGQPLLQLKQGHNPHNLLSSKYFEVNSTSKKQKSGGQYVKKPYSTVQMPPELLLHIDLPLDVLKSLYLLPSLMHRIESLMLASQLRKEIAFHSSDSCISSTLILQAVTTVRCSEDFSSERLELLGDSVLKYALSSYLYLKFPEKHEGQLSSHRSHIVCNAMLHKLGVNRNLQGYIRDAPFDPRRWVAPGQLTIRPFPCTCSISEAPFEIVHTTNDKSIVIGKTCDSGHRWICSKTISDCVEALIGAYYVGGGLIAAIAVMKWLGIDVEMGHELLEKSMVDTSSIPMAGEIEILESKIGYKFTVKGLLLEAITHASQQETGTSFCYQRLEFLGDAALDLLITWYLFNTYKDIDPGELTDLRSASVNNETFAQCAIKHKFQHHLQHASDLLLEQITEYVTRLEEASENECTNSSPKGPKVLGDLVESIAGAILVDTKLDLFKVWDVFKPLLSPIVTPSNLELPPVREILELLSHHGYFLNTKFIMEGEIIVAKLSVQLEKVYLARDGRDKKKKDAKGRAALLLLKDLQKQGITHPRDANKHEEDCSTKSCQVAVDNNTSSKDGDVNECQKSCDINVGDLVVTTVKMKKGGPRTALFELCQKSQWPMPRFEAVEQTLREDTVSANDTKDKKQEFISSITLHIPDSNCIKLEGEARPDKKSCLDSAALVMLYELQRQGRCSLNKI